MFNTFRPTLFIVEQIVTLEEIRVLIINQLIIGTELSVYEFNFAQVY